MLPQGSLSKMFLPYHSTKIASCSHRNDMAPKIVADCIENLSFDQPFHQLFKTLKDRVTSRVNNEEVSTVPLLS